MVQVRNDDSDDDICMFVCSLGLTFAQLLETWKHEAEFAFRLRSSGELKVELFKVVAQREVSTVAVSSGHKSVVKAYEL